MILRIVEQSSSLVFVLNLFTHRSLALGKKTENLNRSLNLTPRTTMSKICVLICQQFLMHPFLNYMEIERGFSSLNEKRIRRALA
jgi:hypothetical protein